MFRHDGMSHLRLDHMLVDQEQWASFFSFEQAQIRHDEDHSYSVPG